MKIYEKAVEDRKVLVERLAELTGQEAVYTRMPRCAYEIGLFTVEKDGRLVANDGAELGIITILQHEGLIGNVISTEEQQEQQQNEQQGEEPQYQREEQQEEHQQARVEPQTEESVERPITIIPAGTKFRYNSETQRIEVADWDAPEDEEEENLPELPNLSDEPADEPADEELAEVEVNVTASEVSNQQGIELQLHAGNENEMSLTEQSIEEATPANLDTSEPAEIRPYETEIINTGALEAALEPETANEAESEITAEENEPQEGQEGINGIGLNLEVAPEPSNEQGMEGQDDAREEEAPSEQRIEEPTPASLDTSEPPAPEEINTGDYELNNESVGNVIELGHADWEGTEDEEEDLTFHHVPQLVQIPDPIPEAEEPDLESDLEQEEVEAPEVGFPSDLSISFPMKYHTVQSLLNLIYMIYTRGDQLSRATRGNFYVEKYLIDILTEDEEFESKEELIDFIQGQIEDGRRCDGISFDEENVTFDGFEGVPNSELCSIYRRLAAQMNKFAIGTKRVRPKEITEPNEKYSFRLWLVRVGMSGSEFKADRKELLRRLPGHSAFRTEADRQKWITRYKKKQLRGSVISKAVDAVQSTIHRVVGSYQQEADQSDQSQLPQQPELTPSSEVEEQPEEQMEEQMSEHYEDKVI